MGDWDVIWPGKHRKGEHPSRGMPPFRNVSKDRAKNIKRQVKGAKIVRSEKHRHRTGCFPVFILIFGAGFGALGFGAGLMARIMW